MLCDGRVPFANRRERAARDTLALVEDLNRRAGDAHLDHLADQLLTIGKDCAAHLKKPFRTIDHDVIWR